MHIDVVHDEVEGETVLAEDLPRPLWVVGPVDRGWLEGGSRSLSTRSTRPPHGFEA